MFNFSQLLATARLALSTIPAQAHEFVERGLTLPKKEREKIYSAAGLDAADRVEADALYRDFADAASDWVVFVASKGAIDAD